MGRGRLLTFGLFAVAAVLGMAAYAYFRFEQPPGFTELPDGWFARPGRDPKDWRAPPVTVKVETERALNLQIIPEDRADLAASLVATPGAPPQALKPGPETSFHLNGDAKAHCPAMGRTDAPTLILRTPRTVRIEAKGAIAASVGPAERLQIISRGCAAWRIADSGQLWASIGKGSLTAGRIEDLRLDLRGPGAARVDTVARSVDLVSRGPAKTAVGRLDGMIDAELWGRGQLDLGSGFAGEARLWLKGPGQILDHGEAGKVEAEARLGGKIRIRATRGVVSGAGDIQVGSPKAPLTGF